MTKSFETLYPFKQIRGNYERDEAVLNIADLRNETRFSIKMRKHGHDSWLFVI